VRLRYALQAFAVVILSHSLLAAQDLKTVGVVTSTMAEFRIPLEQSADSTWKWNRAETADNEGEYIWQVAVPSGGGRYSLGLFLYKYPGSQPASGNLHSLIKAAQASVFKEDSAGHGTAIQSSAVEVSTENDRMVIRIVDPELIHTIFGGHPESATVNARSIASQFEVVRIEYRD